MININLSQRVLSLLNEEDDSEIGIKTGINRHQVAIRDIRNMSGLSTTSDAKKKANDKRIQDHQWKIDDLNKKLREHPRKTEAGGTGGSAGGGAGSSGNGSAGASMGGIKMGGSCAPNGAGKSSVNNLGKLPDGPLTWRKKKPLKSVV